MSGGADISALTDAVNNGLIFAYVAKPWEPLKLKGLIAAAAGRFRLIHEVEQERRLLRALMEAFRTPSTSKITSPASSESTRRMREFSEPPIQPSASAKQIQTTFTPTRSAPGWS